MAFWNRKKNPPAAGEGVDLSRLPRHVGIIMDGNGRWAKKRGLPRTAGHAAGAETFRTIAYYCRDIGNPYLTVYAFSTENWKRSPEEVRFLMGFSRSVLRRPRRETSASASSIGCSCRSASRCSGAACASCSSGTSTSRSRRWTATLG